MMFVHATVRARYHLFCEPEAASTAREVLHVLSARSALACPPRPLFHPVHHPFLIMQQVFVAGCRHVRCGEGRRHATRALPPARGNAPAASVQSAAPPPPRAAMRAAGGDALVAEATPPQERADAPGPPRRAWSVRSRQGRLALGVVAASALSAATLLAAAAARRALRQERLRAPAQPTGPSAGASPGAVAELGPAWARTSLTGCRRNAGAAEPRGIHATADQCGAACAASPRCKAFGYRAQRCADGEGSGSALAGPACLVWEGDCDEEPSGCWDLYRPASLRQLAADALVGAQADTDLGFELLRVLGQPAGVLDVFLLFVHVALLLPECHMALPGRRSRLACPERYQSRRRGVHLVPHGGRAAAVRLHAQVGLARDEALLVHVRALRRREGLQPGLPLSQV
ncbi:unnamed protein product [Prorocentrum cordatum]|uniref:Apple domain-containing protein n=1 Tax=Prorocentrum cordatum TaxID=2364126 RepID=A0ABN9WGG1_9DINO|nr:unnamed protein product [Polarella glacialis]